MNLPLSINKIIEKAQQEMLYTNLIRQLNKDLNLANVNFKFLENIQPLDFVKEIQILITYLLEKDFDLLVNALYIIDVSERKVKSISENMTHNLPKEISLLILQREWQKVWFKSQN